MKNISDYLGYWHTKISFYANFYGIILTLVVTFTYNPHNQVSRATQRSVLLNRWRDNVFDVYDDFIFFHCLHYPCFQVFRRRHIARSGCCLGNRWLATSQDGHSERFHQKHIIRAHVDTYKPIVSQGQMVYISCILVTYNQITLLLCAEFLQCVRSLLKKGV